MLASATQSVVLVVDIQPSFLAPILNKERVLLRTEFLLKVAALAAVPVFITEQYPERMGHTHDALKEALEQAQSQTEGKMRFSCLGCGSLGGWLSGHDRRQVILAGIETHICVNQTAHELLDLGFHPIVAEDAVSARSAAMHANGIARMRSAGATVAHSESIAYEWLGSADHPKFKELLGIVKAMPAI